MSEAGKKSKKGKTRNRIYHISYLAMAVVFLAMIIWAAVKNRGQSPADLLSEGNVAFQTGWQMADGSEIGRAHV